MRLKTFVVFGAALAAIAAAISAPIHAQQSTELQSAKTVRFRCCNIDSPSITWSIELKPRETQLSDADNATVSEVIGECRALSNDQDSTQRCVDKLFAGEQENGHGSGIEKVTVTLLDPK
jgi:hypothetical protein